VLYELYQRIKALALSIFSLSSAQSTKHNDIKALLNLFASALKCEGLAKDRTVLFWLKDKAVSYLMANFPGKLWVPIEAR